MIVSHNVNQQGNGHGLSLVGVAFVPRERKGRRGRCPARCADPVKDQRSGAEQRPQTGRTSSQDGWALATHVPCEHASLPLGAEVVMPPGPAACPREFSGTLPVNPQACPPTHPKLTVASRTPLGRREGMAITS